MLVRVPVSETKEIYFQTRDICVALISAPWPRHNLNDLYLFITFVQYVTRSFSPFVESVGKLTHDTTIVLVVGFIHAFKVPFWCFD